MSTLLSSRVSRALIVLGIGVYVAVAMTEWQLGSAYHAGLALMLAGLFFFTGRGRRVSLCLALMLGAVLLYGVYRESLGLTLLGKL